ncbi:unnamed protein product [Boreogadus saida]
MGMGVASLTVGASVTQTNEAPRSDPNLKCKGSLTGGWADAKRRGVSSELSMSGRYPLAGGVGCGAMREEKHKAKFDSTGRSRLTRRLGWYRCGATGR